MNKIMIVILTLLWGVLGFAMGLSTGKNIEKQILMPMMEKCEKNLPRNRQCHFEAIPNEIIK